MEESRFSIEEMAEVEKAACMLRSLGYEVIPPKASLPQGEREEVIFNPNRPCSFGKFTLDSHEKILAIGDRKEPLTLVQTRILQVLLKNWNQPVAIDDMMLYIWPGRTYTPMANLYTHISRLRYLLKADPTIRLESLRSEGYRLGF